MGTRRPYGALVEEGEDGSQLRRFTLRRRDPFLRWVLSLGGDATVVGPEDLQADFRSMARSVADRHAPADGGESDADTEDRG